MTNNIILFAIFLLYKRGNVFFFFSLLKQNIKITDSRSYSLKLEIIKYVYYFSIDTVFENRASISYMVA